MILRFHFAQEAGGPHLLYLFEVLECREHIEKGAWEFLVRTKPHMTSYARFVRAWVRASDGKVDWIKEERREDTDLYGNPTKK